MNSKSTKKKLTGSIWVLVVCFILLLGTTFAWFTDTASTNVNKIQAGELDVALEMQNAQGEWVSAEQNEDGTPVTLNFVKSADAPEDEEVLWEPGCTYDLPDLRVKNNGNLALKYTVEIAALSGDEELAEVIDVLFLEQKQGENGTAQKIGTLADILNSADEDGFAHGKLAAEATTGTLNISLHMQETAGNEYQGKAINGIQVTVRATQDTVEYDSNGNTYDASAEFDKAPADGVKTLSELKEKLKDETVSEIELSKNISLDSVLTINRDVTIKGYNRAISGNVIVVNNGAKVKFENLRIKGIESASDIVRVTGRANLTLSGTEISNNNSKGNIITIDTGSQIIAEDNVKISGNTTSKHVIFVSRIAANNPACRAVLNNIEIKNNVANGSAKEFIYWETDAGLIAVSDNGCLTINGGAITDNSVKYCTAGVITTRLGEIELNGVTIKDNTAKENGTDCACNKTTCISSHEVGAYDNVGLIKISADCNLNGTNHGSGMGGYVTGKAYNNRDYWPSHDASGGAARPAW